MAAELDPRVGKFYHAMREVEQGENPRKLLGLDGDIAQDGRARQGFGLRPATLCSTALHASGQWF